MVVGEYFGVFGDDCEVADCLYRVRLVAYVLDRSKEDGRLARAKVDEVVVGLRNDVDER